jgi:hypothetical protein
MRLAFRECPEEIRFVSPLVLIFPNGWSAFVLVIKQATLAQTSAASSAVEFVAVANVVPALTALYGSINELKHRDVSLAREAIQKND